MYPVLNRNLLVCLLITLGLWGTTVKPVEGQALVPHILQLDSDQLEQTGLRLAEEALQLARFQQFDLALSKAELATELAPNSQQTWTLLGSLYIQAEKLEEGIYALKQAQGLMPSDPDVSFVLGRAYFQTSDYKSAIEELRKGLKFEPENSGALFDLGNAYYKHGKLKKAIAQYEQAYELNKKLWPAINNIGLVEYEMGKVDNAIAKWRQAVDIDSKAAEPLLAMAVALYAQGNGNKEESLAMGEKALQLDSRYADINYLDEHLWGKRLIGDAKRFIATPRIQDTLARIEDLPTSR